MNEWLVIRRLDVRDISPEFHKRLWSVWTSYPTKEAAEEVAKRLGGEARVTTEARLQAVRDGLIDDFGS
jgi:hypothetical protein